MVDEPAKPKGMCIATRCTSIDQFVEMFHRFVDEDSFFVSTTNTRPPGLETSFSVNLADGTPVLRGTCVVLQAWPTTASPFKTPGVRLGIKRLTASSIPVFERLLVTRTPTPPPRAKHDKPPMPVMSTSPVVAATPKTDEMRTPGSDYVLPANPLTNLTDESLEGFVDCTLYEETANYFPTADDGRELDPLIAPPKPASASAAAAAPPEPEPPVFVPLPVVKAAPPPPPEPPAVDDEDEPSVIIETQADAPPPAPVPPAMLPPIPPEASEPSPVAFASRDSAPAGELADPVARPTTPRRRWPVLALAGGALAAATVLSLQTLGGSQAQPALLAHQPEVSPPSEPPATDVVEAPVPDPVPAPEAEAPPAATAEVPPEHDEDADASVPAEGGAPIVGDGPCRIAVASTPAGSIVYLDGAELAPSPITIATTCGKHKVDIKHPRYKLLTKVVTPADGAPAKVEVTLQRPTHAVQFTSQPSGATVFIDGRRAGTTPTNVSILGFSNLKIEVKKTGYKPLSTRLYSKVARDKFSARLSRW